MTEYSRHSDGASIARRAGGSRVAPRSGARVGSAVLVVLSAATLLAVHVWPGWAAVPFLTPDTTRVLGVFTASLVLSLAVHLLDVVVDRPWLRAAGDLGTAAMGIVVSARLWEVFPFRFDPAGFDWALVVRVLLVVGLVGSAIGVLTGLVALARAWRTDER